MRRIHSPVPLDGIVAHNALARGGPDDEDEEEEEEEKKKEEEEGGEDDEDGEGYSE